MISGKFRKCALAIALGHALLLPSGVHAVGLGELNVESRLFQPLNATIEVYGMGQLEAENLRAKIADTADFLQARLDRHPALNGVRVSVEWNSAGVVFLRLASDRALREPLLSLLIDTEWPGGRMLRSYTLMLDPPAPPRMIATAPARPADAAAAPPRMPTATDTSRPAPATAAAVAGVPGEYGPVRRNEMLGNVAADLRPDAGISLNQMMLALVRENPEAFILDNVNGLRAGAVLRVPDRATIAATSRAEANRIIADHHGAWRARQSLAAYAAAQAAPSEPQPATAVAPAPASTVAPPGAAAQEPTALRLEPTLPPLPSQQAAATVDSTRVSERARELEAELAEARSALARREEQLDELQTRMTVYGAELERLRQQMENYQMQLAATAARAVQPEPEPSVAVSESVFPWLLGGVLGGLGLAGLFGFLLGRRRTEPASPIAVAAGDESFTDVVADLASDMDTGQRTGIYPSVTRTAVQPEVEAPPEPPAYSEEDDEVLSEVEVFVAYGLHDRAREVLRQAIEQHPDRDVYRRKLTEIDRSEAEEETGAEQDNPDGIVVHSELDEDSQQIWSRFAQMGLRLPPESAVIDLGESDPGKTDIWQGKPDTTPAKADAGGDAGPEDLEFDLPDVDEVDEAKTAKEPAQPEEAPAAARRGPIGDYEPTIEVALKLDAEDIEALTQVVPVVPEGAGKDTAPPAGRDGTHTYDTAAQGGEDAEDGKTKEFDAGLTAEFDATRVPPEASPGEPPPASEAGDAAEGEDPHRTKTAEERRVADYITSWQMDDPPAEPSTLELPSNGEDELDEVPERTQGARNGDTAMFDASDIVEGTEGAAARPAPDAEPGAGDPEREAKPKSKPKG